MIMKCDNNIIIKSRGTVLQWVCLSFNSCYRKKGQTTNIKKYFGLARKSTTTSKRNLVYQNVKADLLPKIKNVLRTYSA